MSLKDRAVELVLRARNMLSRDTDAAAKSVRELGTDAASLRSQLDQLENQKALVRQFQDAERATDRAAQALRQAELRVVKLREEMQSSGTATEYQRRQLEAAEKAAEAAGRRYRESATALDTYGREARAAGVNTGELAKEQVRIGRESQQARRSLREFGTEVERSNTFMERFKSTATGVFTGLVGFAGLSAITRGVRNLTRAVGGFFTAGIGSARDFEEQLSRVRAVARPTAEEFEQLRRAADEAGATTQFTATQAAEGLEILSRAGLNAQQSIAALPQVLSVAAAEGLALSEAAGLITDSLGIFREEVDQAGRFADVLAQGAAQANTSMAELGQAIRDGGAEVLAAGQDFEFGVAALNAMADAGIRGGRAGTALRNIMSQLSDPTSTAREELAKLGIETGDLVEVIDGLNQAGPRAQQAILAFGRESGPGLRALLGAGVEGLREFEDALRNAEGSAQEMAATAEDNLAGIWRGVQSAADAVRRGLVEQLMPQFREAALDLQGRLQALANSEALRRIADLIGEVFEKGYKHVKRWSDQLLTSADSTVTLRDRMESLANTMRSVNNFFTTTYATWAMMHNAAKAVIGAFASGVATINAGIATTLNQVVQLLNRFGIVGDSMARWSNETTRQVVADMQSVIKWTNEAASNTVDATRAVIDGVLKQADATEESARASRDAADAQNDLADATGREAEAAEEAAKQESAAAAAVAERAERQTQLKDEIAATEAELDKYREKLRDDPSSEYAQKVGELQNRLRYLKGELRDVTKEAGNFADGLDDAARAIGTTMDELQTGVSSAARAAIDGFIEIASSGQLTSEQLDAAFEKTWARLDSPEARQAFRDSMQEMASNGDDWAARMLRRISEVWEGMGKGAEEAANRVKQSLAEIQQANEAAAKSSEEAGDAAESSSNRAIISWAAWAKYAKSNPVDEVVRAGISKWKKEQLEAGIATDEHTAAILRQREEMERARQETEQLTQSLEQQLQRMREQLAQLRGDQDEVARLRYERERAELQAQYEQARALGDANAINAARELLRLQDQAFQLQQQQTRERERPSAGSTTQQAAAGPAQVAQPTRATRIELVTPTGTANLTADSDRDEQLLIDALGRDARRTTH